MESFRRGYRRIKALFTKDVLERELDDEMRLHIDLLAEQYERSGAPADEAQRLARRRFGNLANIKDRGRDIRGGGVLEHLVRDLQYAARTLRRSPVFTLVLALSLALGIGANTALFTVIDAAFLRKLSVEKPDELVFFRWISGPSSTPFEPSNMSGNFARLERRAAMIVLSAFHQANHSHL
jgi:putative ABC transport system permease protein